MIQHFCALFSVGCGSLLEKRERGKKEVGFSVKTPYQFSDSNPGLD